MGDEGLAGALVIFPLDADESALHPLPALVKEDAGVELGLHSMAGADLVGGEAGVSGLVVDDERLAAPLVGAQKVYGALEVIAVLARPRDEEGHLGAHLAVQKGLRAD